MAATETAERMRTHARASEARRTQDETKHALKTTEFFAMVGIIGAILIASWVSDSLNDVRAWTLVAAVAIGYMISRGLAKSGTKYAGGDDPLNRNNS
jgi:sugar phosphate permease